MKTCLHCNKPIKGRSDKKFCSIQCKNNYHREMKSQSEAVVQTIDNILHRNRAILAELFRDEKSDKITLPKPKLQRLGFRFSNFTGTYLNSKGKTYYYIYDFAWMEFSSNDIMVIRRK